MIFLLLYAKHNNLVMVSKIWLVFADVLYQVLTFIKVDYILANQKCSSKLYFEL